VPSIIVEKVVEDLLNFGEVRRAYLGIQIEPVDEAIAAQLQLTEVKGCAIVGIVPNSGASASELKTGDVVLAIDGTPISDFPELQECIAKYHPGDVVNVVFSREGKRRETPVQLQSKEGSTEVAADDSRGPRQIWIEAAKASLSSLPDAVGRSLGLEQGVQVTGLAPGRFSQAGIRKGFIITKINGEAIQDVAQVEDFFQSDKGGLLIEGVYPNGQKAYYGMAATP
jgi:S1-C subfamily serine protease